MEESVASRLKLFIDTNGLTSTQFADMCGIPRPTLSQILSGRNKKISDILVGQIHRAFPDLSVVWLLFGEGPVKIGLNKDLGESASMGDSISSSITHDHSRSTEDLLRGSCVYGSGSAELSSSTSNNGVQNLGTQADNRTNDLNSTLSGFKSHEKEVNTRSNQIFESDLKILDLQRQIDQMRQNPRKVLQITIYYDDSTFETFVPKS